MDAIELGDGNRILAEEERDLYRELNEKQPVMRYKLDPNAPDGKGEFIGTMPAFPEGSDNPEPLKKTGLSGKGDEGMGRYDKYADIDWETIIERGRELVAEGKSIWKAADIVRIERDLRCSVSMVYQKLKAVIPDPYDKQQAPTEQETAAKLDPAQVVHPEPAMDISDKPGLELNQADEITVKDVLMYEMEQRKDNFDEEFDAAKARQEAQTEHRPESPHPRQITMHEEPVINPYIESLALSSASLASAVIKDVIALEMVKKYLGVGA